MRTTLTLFLASFTSGCGLAAGGYASPPVAAAMSPATSYDGAVVSAYDQAASTADRAPGDERAALALADAAQVALASGAGARGALAPARVVAKVEGALSRVQAEGPEAKARLLLAAGRVQLAAHETDMAVRELEEAFALAPAPGTAVVLLDAHAAKGPVERPVAIRVCEKARKAAATPAARYALIDACLRRLDAASLPFDDREADLAFHAAESERRAHEADARARERRRESDLLRARMRATP